MYRTLTVAMAYPPVARRPGRGVPPALATVGPLVGSQRRMPAPRAPACLRGERRMAPEVGSKAPDFTLKDQDKQEVSLSSFRGDKAVLVVFYPFAFSGICTGEL